MFVFDYDFYRRRDFYDYLSFPFAFKSQEANFSLQRSLFDVDDIRSFSWFLEESISSVSYYLDKFKSDLPVVENPSVCVNPYFFLLDLDKYSVLDNNGNSFKLFSDRILVLESSDFPVNLVLKRCDNCSIETIDESYFTIAKGLSSDDVPEYDLKDFVSGVVSELVGDGTIYRIKYDSFCIFAIEVEGDFSAGIPKPTLYVDFSVFDNKKEFSVFYGNDIENKNVDKVVFIFITDINAFSGIFKRYNYSVSILFNYGSFWDFLLKNLNFSSYEASGSGFVDGYGTSIYLNSMHFIVPNGYTYNIYKVPVKMIPRFYDIEMASSDTIINLGFFNSIKTYKSVYSKSVVDFSSIGNSYNSFVNQNNFVSIKRGNPISFCNLPSQIKYEDFKPVTLKIVKDGRTNTEFKVKAEIGKTYVFEVDAPIVELISSTSKNVVVRRNYVILKNYEVVPEVLIKVIDNYGLAYNIVVENTNYRRLSSG